MTDRLIAGLLLVVAAIHLLPVVGFFGADRISSLYDVELVDQNLKILMRHRAVMFAILGVFFAYAAFNPKIQPIAFAGAAVSICSFLYLAFAIGEFNDAIRRVVIADIVALLSLTSAVGLFVRKRYQLR